MSDTNEIRELITLPIIRVSEYYDEVVRELVKITTHIGISKTLRKISVAEERELERFGLEVCKIRYNPVRYWRA